jgi:phospholipid transport system substrate-binding protein
MSWTKGGERRAWAALLLAPLLLGASATQGAREVVEQTIQQVLQVLARKDEPVEQRVSEIEGIAYQRFDFATISRLVLARNYRRFSAEQKREFETLLKQHLSHSYGSRVDRYDQEKVDIVGAREEVRGDVTVRTKIVGGQADGIEIDYRLRSIDGSWRVIDVVIEGVSLIANYRSQLKEVVARGGPEEVLRVLREKSLPEDDSAS